MKRIFLSIFLTFLVVGCSVNHKLDYPQPKGKVAFTLTDSRPAADREYAYGQKIGFPGYVLGDDSFTPDRVAILKHRLNALVGNQLAGQKIELTRLQSVEYHPNQLAIDALVFGEFPLHPSELSALRSGEYRYWAVCKVALNVNGTLHSGIGVLGYNGPLVDYPGNHTRVLLAAIEQVGQSIAKAAPNK